jgi:hypothetical protein
MSRRGLVSLLFTILMVGGSAGIAAAATTPAPQISPPPQCFVEKDGALPLCTDDNGSWTVTYPTGGGNLDRNSGSNTKQAIGLAIVILCAAGIVAIVGWQWVLPRRRERRLRSAPPTVSGVPATQATFTAYYPEANPAATTPPQRPTAPPPEAFGSPAAAPAPAPAAPPAPPQPATADSATTQLTALDTLLNQGQITREEYDARRQAIVGGM